MPPSSRPPLGFPSVHRKRRHEQFQHTGSPEGGLHLEGDRMIIGFDHTSFTVADIHKTVDFWTKHLGFEVASLSPREGDWQEKVTGVSGAELLIAHLYGHGHHMEFIQYTGGARPSTGLEPSMAGVAHVCLMVDD